MAKYTIFGAGHIGPAIVHLLMNEDTTQEIHIIDSDENKLYATKQKFHHHVFANKLRFTCASAEGSGVMPLLVNTNLVITAIPWAPTFELIQNTIKTNIPFVSVTRPSSDDLTKLTELFKLDSSAVIVGCGLEPGLTEIFAKQFILAYPSTVKLNIYCGGLTADKNPPLYYKQVFGDELPLADRSTYRVINGQLETIERFSGIEEIQIAGIGRLEAFHDGMTPLFINSFDLSQLKEINQKTLRWPGFTNIISALKSLGFMDKSIITIDDQNIIPYRLTHHLLKKYASFNHKNDRDFVALHLCGELENHQTVSMTLISHYNEPFSLSAMANMTGYMTATTAKLLITNNSKGLIYPYELFHADNYQFLVNELRKQNVKIFHSWGT